MQANHSNPVRFIDHLVEEDLIMRVLGAAENKLKHLRTGE